MSIKKIFMSLIAAGAIVASTYTAKWLNTYEMQGQEKIWRVMIIPGHDWRKEQSQPASGRAGKEDEIAFNISSKLEEKLMKDNDTHIKVFMTRGKKSYNKELIDFIEQNFDEIKSLVYELPKRHKLNRNKIDYSVILFGIAKYANDNGYDIMLNIHANDLKKKKLKTKVSGFAIYVSPLNTYAEESRDLAKFSENALLAEGFKPSNNPGEEPINECSQWILLGNYKFPLNARSNVLELDYITNPKLADPKVQAKYADAIHNAVKSYIWHNR